jgi:Uma2 family endonuclease
MAAGAVQAMGSQSILQDAAEGRAIVQPWTVDLYHRAIAEGWLEESTAFELLDGFIVRKDRAKSGEDLVTIGDRHRVAVQRLVRLAARFEPLGHTLQVQQPIQLPPTNEPEPDGTVIRGVDDDYRNGPPGASGDTCVIEVADNSLRRDLGVKLQMYARAGIEQYVVVDLVHDVVLDRRRPSGDRYQQVVSLGGDESVELRAGERSVSVPVNHLLPRTK